MNFLLFFFMYFSRRRNAHLTRQRVKSGVFKSVFPWCYEMGLAAPRLPWTQQQCLSSSHCTHMDSVARPRAPCVRASAASAARL